ncbi:MAG: replication initiation protein [Gammaproteobacteria bacterium]|nr:replication initiation protein [Gammaproteobacteria bacterium]
MTAMGLTVTTVGSEKKANQLELKKHAATIHCSNALSLLQRKISNALLYHSYKELLIKEEHEITIKQLCNLISYSGNNHAAIKDALKGLISTVIEWNVVNDTTGAEDWTASSMIASVSLQGPICYFAYSPRMKQLLHSPSMFGKINLYIQSRFKSSYGLALYENCIRYRGLPYTKWFDMQTFRKLMGVPPENYIIFRDFKRRVLDKSIEEVNTYSDLLVDVEFAREKRQVAKIRFALKERPKKNRLGILSDEVIDEAKTSDLREQLIKQFGLSPRQVENILTQYDEAFIIEKIAIVESSKNYQSGKIKNCAAYLRSALKNDYQQSKSSTDSIKLKKQEENQIHYNLKELKRIKQEIEESYMSYRENTIDEAINALNAEEHEEFMQSFQQYAATSIKTILKLQRKKYTPTTILKSPQIKGLLRQFALQKLTILNNILVTLEKYLETFSEEQRNAWYQLKLFESHDLKRRSVGL